MSARHQSDVDAVRIDHAHAHFVQALVMCHKPRRILEFGFGTGSVTRSIMGGLQFNQQAYAYTVVDNWHDYGGIRPAILDDPHFAGIAFVTSNELEFLGGTHQPYDFIFSDADHQNTQNWFEHVYTRFLARGGVLIYHDVTNAADFPNLLRLYQDTVRHDYHHVLFSRNSRSDERCDRGMLVIFKH